MPATRGKTKTKRGKSRGAKTAAGGMARRRRSAASKPGKKATSGRKSPADVPQFFRLNVEVGDLDRAAAFYEDPWENPLCFVEEGTVYRG